MLRLSQLSGLELFPNVVVDEVQRGTPTGAPSSGIFGDCNVETQTTSVTWSDFLFLVDSAKEIQVSTETPGICDIENFPSVARVSDGTGIVRVQVGRPSRNYRLQFDTSGGASTSRATSPLVGGHIEHAWDLQKPLLDAPGAKIGLFDSIPDGGSFINSLLSGGFNTSCWAGGWDWSGIGWTPTKRMAAVTARHLVCAAHAAPDVGETIYFLGTDEVPVSRSVLGVSPLFNESGPFLAHDRAIVTLSSDLPGECAVYPVVASNFGQTCWLATYAGSAMESFHFQGMRVTKNCEVTVIGDHKPEANYVIITVGGKYFSEPVQDFYGLCTVNFPKEDLWDTRLGEWMIGYENWWTEGVGDDSGSPGFFPIDGSSMALVGTLSNSAGGGGLAEKSVLDILIQYADTDAGVSTGYTTTVAIDPLA